MFAFWVPNYEDLTLGFTGSKSSEQNEILSPLDYVLTLIDMGSPEPPTQQYSGEVWFNVVF